MRSGSGSREPERGVELVWGRRERRGAALLSGTNMCGWVRVRSGVGVCVGVGGEDAGCEADEEGREGEAGAGWATRARRVGMSVLRNRARASQSVS